MATRVGLWCQRTHKQKAALKIENEELKVDFEKITNQNNILQAENTKFTNVNHNLSCGGSTPDCKNCNSSIPDSHALANHVESNKLDVKQNDKESAVQPQGRRNKYAIYAYTHGPVTGSGPSVVILFRQCVKSHILTI